MCETSDDANIILTIGVCAMAKKAMSKPMKEILRRMDKFQHIRQIIFDEHVILNEPIEAWPICDALVSFYSEGFPLEKAIAYSKLRKPYLVNDLESQYILMDRRRVYQCLQLEGVPVPRYACVSRKPGSRPVEVIESDDSIEIDGEVFHKPFVEKPLNAEDHNVYIYFPSSAGGGSQRLFRKVGNLSSKYFPYSTIRTNGSYMYEEFMPTDGTDVKVYTVADDYAHAEARKSPALDGKVERDHEGKEVRYPVILTPREKIIAKKVAKAVRQQICGFDLLRANGMSYVCDVNGFSFVKSSRKYYDDCSHILGVLITRKLAPRLCLPANLPPGTDVDTPLVPTTCGTIMELRCVIAVIRHGDRTPKQKMKMEVRHEKFFSLFTKYAGDWTNELKLKRPTQLQEVLDIVRCILDELDTGQCSDPQLIKNKPKFEQLRYVLEMYGTFSGINRKIQLKYHPQGIPKGSKPEMSELLSSAAGSETPRSLLLVVKWGGELTAAGRQQAETLGRAFRCIYPGGDGHYGKDPGLGLLRLHSTYRHDLKIYASDEGRVQMTAAAFAKGFLALEGELPPILVQMVKSANTNGLLDNDNDCRHYQNMVKRRIRDVMTKTTDFSPDDIAALVPTGAKSLVNAMWFLGNPRRACDRLYAYMKHLGSRLLMLATSPKDRGSIQLYQGESWELLLRRWGKLLKDFRNMEDEYDLSKISDIYDNIKYDLQHNPGILLESEAHDFFMCAKSLADIVVPQEYGITKEEKLVIGQRICTPLMRKILSDARYTDVDECTRLHAGYSKGVASPERFVRTRLYFTSESHLHSLLTCLRYGELADITTDEQWRRAMDYVSSISEINYLAQIVIMIYEDPTEEPKTEKRFHVELHFSPGAFSLCHDLPEGIGFRPGKLERLNSQASVVSSATSVGKYSNDSFPQFQRSGGPVGSGYSSSALSGINSTSLAGRQEPLNNITGATSVSASPRKIRRPVYSVSMEHPLAGFTDAVDTPTKASGSRSSLGNLSAFSANLEASSPSAIEMQKVAERLEHVKHWRETAVMNSSDFNTGTTTTTTGSTSDVGEDDEVIMSTEDDNGAVSLMPESSDPVRRVQGGRSRISSTGESTSIAKCTLSPHEQTLTPGLSAGRTSLPHPSPVRPILPPTSESTACADTCATLPVTSVSLPSSSGVGIGRFIITRSVAEPSEARSSMSPSVHTKSVVVLPTDNTITEDNSGTPASVSQKTSPFIKTRSHHGRSKQLEAHTNGRLTVSCSPERYRTASTGADPSLSTKDVCFSSRDANKLCVSSYSKLETDQEVQILPNQQQWAARSVPLTRWLLEQAELVRAESGSSFSMGKIAEQSDSKLFVEGSHLNLPTESVGETKLDRSEYDDNSIKTSQVRRGKSVSIDVSARPSGPETITSPKDDLIPFVLSPSPGTRQLVRYHSTGSLQSVPTGQFTGKTTSSSRSRATHSPSRMRNQRSSTIQDNMGPLETVTDPRVSQTNFGHTMSGAGSKYTLVPTMPMNPTEPRCDLYLDGAGGLRSKLLRPSTNAMCDAIMAFANLIEQPHADETEDAEAANQALNAMTYPSSQNTYHLDIERLVRAVVQGAPVPRPFCRSLISTAVIRGSRDDAQASSSVPDIKRLMDDAVLAPRTLTPGSSSDFLVPSAPCVPEVYPLETLHNALTLSQLEAFFARLTTRKFPTPFTSPQHPSTPVTYYHQYHDSVGSLISGPQTNTSTTEMLTSEYQPSDNTPVDVVPANHYVNTACQPESTVAPTTAVFRLITVHKPSDTTTEGFGGPDSDTATDNVWIDDVKFTEPDRTDEIDSGTSEQSA